MTCTAYKFNRLGYGTSSFNVILSKSSAARVKRILTGIVIACTFISRKKLEQLLMLDIICNVIKANKNKLKRMGRILGHNLHTCAADQGD